MFALHRVAGVRLTPRRTVQVPQREIVCEAIIGSALMALFGIGYGGTYLIAKIFFRDSPMPSTQKEPKIVSAPHLQRMKAKQGARSKDQ